MDYKERIKELIHEGKINSDQAVLLLNALKESEKRREKIFRQVESQKKSRNRSIWGFLSVWILVILVSLGFIIYLGNRQSRLEKSIYYEETRDVSMQDKESAGFDKANKLTSDSRRRTKMNNASTLFGFVFVLLMVGILSVIILVIYNLLVKREEKVNEAWGQVASLCQRKLDLIPALLEATKNYAQHEWGTLQSVIEARAKAQGIIEGIGGIASADKEKIRELSDTQNKIALGLGRIFGLIENYPELKANTNFLTLQQQLQDTEDRIANGREIYNNSAREYNSSIRYFPSNLISALFKFQAKEYFKAEEKSREGGVK